MLSSIDESIVVRHREQQEQQSIIAEILRAQGARAEPHTLENLVTHLSEKFWLSRDCPYVCPSVRQHLENLESNTITIATSLILGVHAIVN